MQPHQLILFSKCLLFIYLPFLLSQSYALDNPISNIIDQKKVIRLAKDREWQKILFYAQRWHGKPSSLVDSKEFFFSSQGKYDPYAELMATLNAFISQSADDKEFEAAQCRFPRRWHYLKKKLPQLKSYDKSERCFELNVWLSQMSADKLSLVFSSYYVNNPSSMMGHIFLRFHSKDHKSALLDQTIGYTAEQYTDFPPLYTILGLSGGFKGVFIQKPYYLMIQQYGHAERRDLFEYTLNFTQDNIQNILFSLWEMGPNHINYFYFDENCASIILYLLEAANPQINLTSRLNMFVTPSDSLKIIATTPKLISDFNIRPSSSTKFSKKLQNLSKKAKQIFLASLDDPAQKIDETSLKQLTLSEQITLTDSILSYITFDEKLAGDKLPQRRQTLYMNTLQKRASLPSSQISSSRISKSFFLSRPDKGHRGAYVSMGYTIVDNSPYTLLNWRPALHSFTDIQEGYPPELSIEMGAVSLSINDALSWKLQLEKFHIFDIQSLSQAYALGWPLAWSARLGWYRQDQRSGFLLAQAGIGFGLSIYQFSFFALLLTSTFSNTFAVGQRVGFKFFDTTQWTLATTYETHTKKELDSLQINFRHKISTDISFGLSYGYSKRMKNHLLADALFYY